MSLTDRVQAMALIRSVSFRLSARSIACVRLIDLVLELAEAEEMTAGPLDLSHSDDPAVADAMLRSLLRLLVARDSAREALRAAAAAELAKLGDDQAGS